MRTSSLKWLIVVASVVASNVLFAGERVFVKYRGDVDLAPFTCETVSRSSFINRLCYDAKEKYVVVLLQRTYYHYCEVPANLVQAWLSADSMGKFYNANVKGKFDCRVLRVPSYRK